MIRFERLAIDCNDKLYIYDGAHAIGAHKVGRHVMFFSPFTKILSFPFPLHLIYFKNL